MTVNEQIIHKFYTAFQERDYSTMQSCYSDDAVFSDPVFGLLDAGEAKAMWEMLCKGATGLQLSFGNIQLLDDEYATCDWIAKYTFTKTGRKVINRIRAHMRFKDGLIIEHSDAFAIYRWSRQAFGITGMLFGWTAFMHRRIQSQAKEGLQKFISSYK